MPGPDPDRARHRLPVLGDALSAPSPSDGLSRKAQALSARALREELIRAGWITALGAAAGYFAGQVWAGASLALAAWFAVYLRRLALMRAWAAHPKQIELPEFGGVWGELYGELLDLQRRNRRRKKRLAAMLAEFQASTEALPDGAVVVAPAGEIAWFNSAAQTLLGLRNPQDIGLRLPNLIRHPDFSTYLERGEIEGEYSGDIEVPSPLNRATTLALRLIPYGNGQRLLIVRDVSERKRLETVRRDFVANASHELRTPLTVLRGYLEMMQPDSAKTGSLQDWQTPLAEMRAQAARMESLIADMLRLARLESGAPLLAELLDVPRLLEGCLADARSLSAGRHRIESSIEAQTQLLGRESEIHSILGNLLHNAVHYTPEGRSIRARWWGDESGAHFSVEDQGIGIADKDIPRLTERFYRVDVGRSRATGGTGLGLTIVQQALERHEGRLEITSVLGAGSTFTAHFPAARLRKAAHPLRPVQTPVRAAAEKQ